MKYMDFREILEIIAEAANKEETVEIYYPKTENSAEGWREVEVKSKELSSLIKNSNPNG